MLIGKAFTLFPQVFLMFAQLELYYHTIPYLLIITLERYTAIAMFAVIYGTVH